nr:MAG TPA: hypothetical protein [Caudoviricetes sp.]
MLTNDEMYSMMKLQNKYKDSDAQAKFNKWYSELPPEDKQQFDKHRKKIRLITGIVVVAFFCLVGTYIFGDNHDAATTVSSNVEQKNTSSTTQSAPQKEEANLFTVQEHIQEFYKSRAQTYGTGYPEVDCAFASHYQKEIAGLIYMEGKYTLSTDKATHTYNARYGAGSKDLLYLVLDGQKVLWNEEREDYYQDLDFKKSQAEQGDK